MGSRDKSFQEKLRSFFRTHIRSAPDSFVSSGRETTGLILTHELERDLSADTPIIQRLKNVKDLHDKIIHCRLDTLQTLERLWLCVADLIQSEQPKECRHAGLIFLRKLIESQYDLINIMRAQFFKIITGHNHPEDNYFRLELLQTLTLNGKDILYFEEEIFIFMLQWMPTVVAHPELSKEFLLLLVNLIKFNTAFMSKEVTTGFISNTCFLCCESHVVQVGLSCLQVLDAIVCYSIFPHESLQTFISALCKTVNDEQYCPTSWKIMRCMLGTDLGHSALHIMCMGLGTSSGSDYLMVRGAIFYLYMALWGPKRVASLKCTPTQVLPSFLKALEGNQSVVTYEVILAMQVLVQKHGPELHEPTWDLIFAIISTIIKQLGQSHPPIVVISRCLHETITAVEQIHENGQFNGSIENLYSLIDSCGHTRPDNSVIKLITHLTSQIVPTNYEWLTILNRLVERYCRQESRVNIRIKVLETLQTIVEQNRFSYEEELLDKVVLPNLQQCSTEADPVIRCSSAKLLIEIALHCHSKRFTDIFDILEKLLNRQYELYVTAEPITLPVDCDVKDITVVANGIVRIFLYKYRQLPSAHAVRAYLAVLNHLQQHYAKPALFQNHSNIRLKLLEWFLSARANSSYHIGFPSESGDRILYSPYLCIEGSDLNVRPSHSPTPQSAHQITGSQVSYVSIRKACKIIITCLKHEKDWSVLQVVLKEIPNVMQNKALVLSKNSNDIDQLASALCSMVVNTSLTLPESLYNTSGKLTKSDFHASVLPVLTCLAPYHAHLDSQLQQRIIKCIVKFGLVISRCAQQCVTALTIFALEMRDTMMKLLPEVLLDLSKISATVYIAVPILEFLSTLTRLPKVYASFVGEQYMSVFAILLPYTNLFKYNHYIVSLAHHVIAAWFLKCRLPFRRDFVTYIRQALHNNILKPFEEGKFLQDYNLDLNQDSSSRKRSSSLTEQGSRLRELPSRPALGELRTPQEASNTFHIELTETCIDLLARYTFSPYVCAPKRSPTSEFLLAGGQSMTWLLGHKIITVTTSGCLQNALRQGLCERCLVLCKAHADSLQSPYNGVPTANSGSDEGLNSDIKRYSKYTLQHSKSNETTNSSSSISDNILFPPSCHNNLSIQSLSGHTTRQNSAENKSDATSCSPKAMTDIETNPTSQLSLKLESLANKQISDEKTILSSKLDRVSGVKLINSSNSGLPENRLHCACWCGGWAEIHIRGPTGDVSWVMRLQNQGNLDMSLGDMPLNDISSLFLPSLSYGMFPLNIGGAPPFLGSATSIVSSGFADTRSDVLSDDDPRSRSGSGGSQPDQIQKSSSDSVVSETNVGILAHVPHASTDFIVHPNHNTNGTSLNTIPNNSKSHTTTDPINIPGSPQRQNSSGTNTDDEDGQINSNDPSQALDDQGKSRHPVRRSNSSPEMSSSWKNPFHIRMEGVDGEINESKNADVERSQGNNATVLDPHDVSYKNADENIGSTIQQAKKGAMKSLTKDMRVSCEAIPEEMSSFTPPQHLPSSHPHLMTFNSDPGSIIAADAPQVSSTSVSEKNIVLLSNNQFENLSVTSQGQTISDPNAKLIKNNVKNGNAAGEKLLTAHEHLKVSTKPPHSPAPASPRPTNRLQGLAASARNSGSGIPINRSASLIPSDATRVITNLNLKFNESQGNQQQIGIDDLPPLARSKRSNTISVMSPTRKRKEKSKDPRSGINPAFVFLQLFYGSGIGGNAGDKPLLLCEEQHTRSVKNLDLIPPLETYRVGVMYVGPGQHDNETKILKNEFGSLRYAEFLQDLGTLIALEDAKSLGLFLNVERGGRDGRFAYVWQDDIMQVHFHVATLMPNNASDPECNEKRKHIGNDFVSIIYNESGEDFQIQTIKGQFNFVCIIIEPLDHGTNKVTIKTKNDLIEKEFLSQFDPKIISDQNVALLARQLALHANLASLISRSLSTKPVVPYASNWLERLRSIKRLRNKLLKEKNTSSKESNGASVPNASAADTRRSHMENFIDYTCVFDKNTDENK